MNTPITFGHVIGFCLGLLLLSGAMAIVGAIADTF
jgi:hypothetical protein